MSSKIMRAFMTCNSGTMEGARNGGWLVVLTTSANSCNCQSDTYQSMQLSFKNSHTSSLVCRRNKQFSTVNSTTSTASSTKYDPDLLKADVTHAKARVQRLRRELANIHIEMDYKQRGVETLNNVNAKFTEAGRGLTLEEAAAIRTELLSIQQSLCTGEREKVELMKSLACLKDDLTRLQPSESSLDVSAMRELERLSTASQTDLSGEVRMMLMMGWVEGGRWESCGIGAFLSCWRTTWHPSLMPNAPINTPSRNSSPNCWHNVEIFLRHLWNCEDNGSLSDGADRSSSCRTRPSSPPV